MAKNIVRLLLVICCISYYAAVKAQQDSTAPQVFNSYKNIYANSNPTLLYSYTGSTQTHDYSGNWDFDKDGKKDRLYFIGNGGAHLYYHLRIVLSSDNTARDFPFLAFDLPILGNISELKKSNTGFPVLPQFVVHDFDADGVDEIYLHLDTMHCPIPRKWKRKGLTSPYILVKYKNQQLLLKNFSAAP